jgi:uncharacterized damage-inducible protein DinB
VIPPHILAAELVWFARWQGESPTSLVSPDKYPDLATLRREWTEHERRMRLFVERLGEDGIRRVFEYRLISGVAGSSPFWQILQHLVNHGTYHRGQVTTLLRQIGAKPPQAMDLIAYYRTQQQRT